MLSGLVTSSQIDTGYNMDLLGNLNTANALALNGVNAAVKFNTNATNEIT